MVSSVIFGFIPVLSKEGQLSGVSPLTMTFLRMVLSLPVMLAALAARRVPLRLERKELKSVMLLGFFGMAGAMLMLNSSYGLIDVGIATAVHFVYPVLIVLWCVLRGEKKSAAEWAALALVMIGIALFVERGGGKNQTAGIITALLSGGFYAFYVIYSARAVKEMNYFKLAFYVCLFAGIALFVFGMIFGGLGFSFGSRGWVTAILVSALSSLCAIPLFQAGVHTAGASRAGVLSTVEPITGFLCGSALLGESVTVYKLIGSALIVTGVILTEKKK